jgi:hypothetical protein
VICGAVSGGGGKALGMHLAAPQPHDDARPGDSRGLMSEGIEAQTRELTEAARETGHKSPLRHVHASPPPGADWDADTWGRYWSLYERALGLEGCMFAEAIHDKPGDDGRPPHRHRVYLAVTERGTLVRTGHDYAVQEVVSRITEFDTGAAMVKGAHNVRAATIAASLGREDVAAAMRAAGLLDGARARADLSPAARAQQERTGIGKADIARMTATAWASADTGPAFAAALRDAGLVLAQGDKCPVILDVTGNAHSLQRMLAMAARADGGPAPPAADVAARLAGMDVPMIAIARQAASEVPPPPTGGMPVPAATATSDATPSPEASGSAPSPSRDGAVASLPPSVSLGGGGGAAPQASVTGQGASLDDAGPGPGEPPSPGAHPDEIARYRAKLAAHAEAKAKAAARFAAATAAAQERGYSAPASQGGGHHGVVQQKDAAAGIASIASAFAHAGREDIRSATPAGRDGYRPSGEGQSDTRRSEGRTRDRADRGEPLGGDGAAVPGGKVRHERDEGAAGDHRHEADEHRRQAFRHRAESGRFARCAAGLSFAPLLDRLDPARPALRAVASARADIDRRRESAPYADPAARDGKAMAQAAVAALHAEQQARVRAAATASEHAALAREALPAHVRALAAIGWTARARAEVDRLDAQATRLAEAAEYGRPTRATVEKAELCARRLAAMNSKDYEEWQARDGVALDSHEAALDGIEKRLREGDPATMRAVETDGLDAAIRAEQKRQAAERERHERVALLRGTYGQPKQPQDLGLPVGPRLR